MDVLKVEDLFLSHGNQQVLDHIIFSIKKGKILDLLGPNGAGKRENHFNLSLPE